MGGRSGVRGAIRAGRQVGLLRVSGISDTSGANEIPGSQVGSQHRPASGHTGPRPAIVVAGERHARLRPALSGNGRSVYGMQEVRSSNLRSSTAGQRHDQLVGWTVLPLGEGHFEGQDRSRGR
jgi:hypothetical protein